MDGKPDIRSAHKNSSREEYELLFHRALYLPEELIDKCEEMYQKFRGRFRNSWHVEQEAGCDRGHLYDPSKIERIANAYTTVKDRIFEVATVYSTTVPYPYVLKKFVARFPYENGQDVSIVFWFKNKVEIRTAWINSVDDNHIKLNDGRYVKDKQDRKSRVKYYKSLIDGIRYKGPSGGGATTKDNGIKENISIDMNRINEMRLRDIVSESVKRALAEAIGGGDSGYGGYSAEDLVAIAKAVISVYGNGNLIESNPNPEDLVGLLKHWEHAHNHDQVVTNPYSAFKTMVTSGGW